jgi:FkbM family methyltransferase
MLRRHAPTLRAELKVGMTIVTAPRAASLAPARYARPLSNTPITVPLSRAAKVRFYAAYFGYHVIGVWFEVRRPRLRAGAYTMLYVVTRLLRRPSLVAGPSAVGILETRFGHFRVRPQTSDIMLASPAFERLDVNHLVRTLEAARREGRRFLFVDVGSGIGTYSVIVGNRFRSDDGDIVAFEPLSSELLRENLLLNDLLHRVEVHDIALGDREAGTVEMVFEPSSPSSGSARRVGAVAHGTSVATVPITTMDAALGDRARLFDLVVMKLDVEGLETEVLRGAAGTLRTSPQVLLLVEDFVDGSVVEHLRSIGARCIAKVTPYNSWWELRNAKQRA